MKRTFIIFLTAVLFVLTACGEKETQPHLMKRISDKNNECYVYIPLTWEDDTTDTTKELAAHVTGDFGTATFSVTTEEQEVEDESEEFWSYWLTEEWWADFWEKEIKSSWNVLSQEECTVNNSTCYKCTYTEGDNRITEIASVRYYTLYRIVLTAPTSADCEADFDEILGAFLWK